jgi:hypothetical protein
MPRAGRRSCYREVPPVETRIHTKTPACSAAHNTWANTHHPSSPSPAVNLLTKLLHQTKRQHPPPGPRKHSCTEHATKAANNVPAGLQHHIQHSKVLPTKTASCQNERAQNPSCSKQAAQSGKTAPAHPSHKAPRTASA